MPPAWRTAAGYQVFCNAWPDGYSAFHSGRGDTHLLDHHTGEALSCLLRQPMSFDELALALTGNTSPEPDSENARALDNALNSLRQVYLIEQDHS